MVGVAILGASLLGACGDDGPLAASPTPGELRSGPLVMAPPNTSAPESVGEVVEVQSLDNQFRQQEVTVAAGTQVRWVNAGQTDHDVQPVDLGAVWGIGQTAFPPGAEYSFVFSEPGEYPYYCSLHGTETVGMIGTIVVDG